MHCSGLILTPGRGKRDPPFLPNGSHVPECTTVVYAAVKGQIAMARWRMEGGLGVEREGNNLSISPWREKRGGLQRSGTEH